MRLIATVILMLLGICWGRAIAVDPAAKKKTRTPASSAPKPTLADVAYGPHQQQKMDFYKAQSDKPTPLLFFIHGGGWKNGDKGSFNDQAPYLAAGISVVSINYRHISHAEADKIAPPVKAPLHDAARALQFVRTKAAEWNIDKARIGASGSSAGACTSLWLAFHPDLADSESNEPVARESTRLWCAAVVRAQTSLDPKQMVEWIPNSFYGFHAFGFKGDTGKPPAAFAEFLAKRDTILPWIAEYSPYALVSADDPPVYLFYDLVPAMGQTQENPTHSPNFGVGLAEKLKSAGVEHELVYPGAQGVKHANVREYLVERLKSLN
jgi:acetyl esterase/lipase